MTTLLLLALSLAATAPPAWADKADGGWRSVGMERGVKLYERSVPKRDLPRIKGILDIDASVFSLLGVLADLNRACEWNNRCLQSRILDNKGLTEVVFYHRTDFPWPVSDRDVVLVTRVTGYDEGEDVTAAFSTTQHPKRPVRSDAVRINYMRGHFRLQRLSPTRTRAIYELDADPGGWLPAWVVAGVTRGIPSATLSALAAYERRHRARYAPFVRKHEPSPARPPRPADPSPIGPAAAKPTPATPDQEPAP